MPCPGCLLPHPRSRAGTLHPITAPPPTPSRAVTVERWSGLPTPLLEQRWRHLPLIPARQAGTGRQAGRDLRQGDAVPRSGAQNSSGPPQIWTGGTHTCGDSPSEIGRPGVGGLGRCKQGGERPSPGPAPRTCLLPPPRTTPGSSPAPPRPDLGPPPRRVERGGVPPAHTLCDLGLVTWLLQV